MCVCVCVFVYIYARVCVGNWEMATDAIDDNDLIVGILID